MTLRACLILLVTGHGARAQGRQAAPGLTRGPSGSENATCYGRRYPDLAYHLCKDECNVQALHRHFQSHGRREGRRFGCEAAPLTAAEAARWEAQAARARARDVQAGPAATPAPEPPTGPLGLADRLEKLAALHERGALTDAEFAKAKANLLGL